MGHRTLFDASQASHHPQALFFGASFDDDLFANEEGKKDTDIGFGEENYWLDVDEAPGEHEELEYTIAPQKNRHTQCTEVEVVRVSPGFAFLHSGMHGRVFISRRIIQRARVHLRVGDKIYVRIIKTDRGFRATRIDSTLS